MPRAKKEPERCKHRITTDGKNERCKAKAGDDGWCGTHRKLHRSTGPKTPAGKAIVAKNGITHGFYSAGFTPEEKAQLAASSKDVLDLSGELMLARAQLRRAWVAAGIAIGAKDPEAGLELVETKRTSEQHGDAVVRRYAEIKKRAPDWALRIDRTLRTIAQLVQQHTGVMEVRDLQGQLEELLGRLQRRRRSVASAGGNGAGGNGAAHDNEDA
uniref:Uncharacterized protein n=1 Tax=viral metagenome TaxID=1070528 RepID=A0A6M3J3D6_9ZZZZ